MNELILARHGATAWNEARRLQGASDPPLSQAGRAEARLLGSRLAGSVSQGQIVWTSDLRRARETARLALPEGRLRPDARLREYDFGVFDGSTWEENESTHGNLFREWAADPEAAPPPGGETLKEFRARVAGWLAEVRTGDRRGVVVAHGGVIGMIHALLTFGSFSKSRLLMPPTGGFVELRRSPAGAWTLVAPETSSGKKSRISRFPDSEEGPANPVTTATLEGNPDPKASP